MKVCPSCRQQFTDEIMFCPNDGGTLVEESTEDALIGRLLEGKYRIEKELGRGGMGTVYQATNIAIERTVAIKVLNPELISNQQAVERFRREARAAGRINHPNAIQVMDFGVTNDKVVFLVMEYLEGKSLRDYFRDKRLLSPSETARIMKPVCAAVDAAHRKGIIHRDLKPDNIMLQKIENQEVVKVLDFGIAQLKSLGGSGNSQHLTQTGMIVGTPYYMSPEQCHGEELDARSDVYSLGIILYELLTGKLPFTAPTSVGIILKHTSERPRPLTEINKALAENLQEVVLRAMEKDRARRQASAAELGAELEEAVGGSAKLKRSSYSSGELMPAPRTNEPFAPGTEPSDYGTHIGEMPSGAVDHEMKTEVVGAMQSAALPPAAATEMMDEDFDPVNYETHVPGEVKPKPGGARATVRQDGGSPANMFQTKIDDQAAVRKPDDSYATSMGIAADTAPMGSSPQVVKPSWTFPLSKIASAEKRSKTSFYVSVSAAAATLIIVAVLGLSWIRTSVVKEDPVKPSPVDGPKIPANMLPVLSGTFTMGRSVEGLTGKKDNFALAETPEHDVSVQPFYLAKYELTRREYREFLQESDHPSPKDWNGKDFPPGTGALPVVNVSWEDANAYCEWLSKKSGYHYRLPTEEEWEFAARGTDKREYPWGNFWDKSQSNSKEAGSNSPLPVESFSNIESPYGVINLAGNVSEWTSSDLSLYPGSTAKAFKFKEGDKPAKIIRGGNYSSPQDQLMTTSRFWAPFDAKEPTFGFRLAMDVPKN